MSASVKRRRAIAGSRSKVINPFPSTLPVGNLIVDSSMGSPGTWTQVFANDFDYVVPVGGIVPNGSGTALVAGSYAKVNTDIDNWASFYPNNTNSSWGEKTSELMSTEAGYIAPGQPGYPATYLSHAKWYPGKTVEFKNSCFIVHFHAEDLNGDGTMYGLGAAMNIRNPTNPSIWKMPFCRYQFRMRHTNHVGLTDGQTSYWTSVPLAIDSSNWSNGELNWPEMDSNKTVIGHYHPKKTRPPDETLPVASGESAKNWITYTVEWVPTRVRFWAGNQLRLDTTDRVPTDPMAIVMQHEQNWRAGVGSSDMEMDWLSIWFYTP